MIGRPKLDAFQVHSTGARWQLHWDLWHASHQHESPAERLKTALAAFCEFELAIIPGGASPVDIGPILTSVVEQGTHSPSAIATAARAMGKDWQRQWPWRPFIGLTVAWWVLVFAWFVIVGTQRYNGTELALKVAIVLPAAAAAVYTAVRWAIKR